MVRRRAAPAGPAAPGPVPVPAATSGGNGPAAAGARPGPAYKFRKTRAYSFNDWLELVGSLVASYAVMYVGYSHLLDFSGILGFGLCWYLVFMILYGTVLSVGHARHVVTDRLVAATLYLIAVLVLFALGTTLVYTFTQGWPALKHLNFFTHDMAGVAPTAPLTKGGAVAAIVGTLVEIGIAIAVSVPLGIGTAVYMTEVGGRGSRLVRTVVESMTALPEILAGLFVYAVLIVDFRLPKAGLAVAIAMSVTMVPIIARASDVALRVAPAGLREASSALGASQWRTVWRVVLPSVRAGLATAVILAIARGIGETAIPLITSGASGFTTVNPVSGPMNSLPLYVYTANATHEPNAIFRAFGAASVLLVIVLVLFGVARLLLRSRTSAR